MATYPSSFLDARGNEIVLASPSGPVTVRYYPATGASHSAVVLVGGAGGGWDSPSRDLYGVLADELPREGVSVLRVKFRRASHLDDCVSDVLVGMELLVSDGVVATGLVGHSFGGAVVLRAAVASPEVRAVVCLAPQSHGADAARDLRPRTSLLVVHGLEDDVLPASCSRQIMQWAPEPKEIVLFPRDGHGLDESADDVHRLVHHFLKTTLGGRDVVSEDRA
jgi:hypothetical protein